MDLIPTPSQTVGPYFHLGCTTTHAVGCIAGQNARGERVRLVCRVLDGDGLPVDDAMIEIWQADSEGRYSRPADCQAEAADPDRADPGCADPGCADPGCGGFGRLATDANGTCVFETIRPGRVPCEAGSLQAPHLNVSVFARGVMRRLVTRAYFAGDPANHECPILAFVPKERQSTLMAHRDSRNRYSDKPDSDKSGEWHFDVRLCGEHETVFFDV
jgi:protocatechuate 3,4-dioxygenase alpha subunit